MRPVLIVYENIFQNNRLDLYWTIGDPVSGKWTAAWLVDSRGFTSWSRPWSAAWKEKVHLLWTWCDATYNKTNPEMGIFHVEWNPSGFARKVQVASGIIEGWEVAIDPQSGRILVVFSKEDEVYVISRSEREGWTQAVPLHSKIKRAYDISVETVKGGNFIIRLGSEDTQEWLLKVQ